MLSLFRKPVCSCLRRLKTPPVFLLAACLIPFLLSAQSDSTIFGSKEKIGNALVGKIYLIPENTPSLPNFDTLQSVGTIYTDKMNIPTRDWQSGFPGISSRFEWFAIDYKGYFKVKKPGKFDFRLVSDDGSRLYIDGKLVVDNDGVHATASASGSVQLRDSTHSIRLQYFQGPRYQIALQLFVNEKPFPDELILTDPDNGFPYWVLGIPLLLLAGYLGYKRLTKAGETFIEVTLLDKDGKGVAGERVRFTLPNGTVTEGELDANGHAMIAGFKPGDCSISFPNLDTKDWKEKQEDPLITN